MGNGECKFLVTGGTGTLGRLMVGRLRNTGRDIRVLSRHSHDDEDGVEVVTGDLATGEGIEAAVDGTEIVLHIAGSSNGDADKACHLKAAAPRAGVRHVVYISVIGADRIRIASGIDRAMFGCFGSKLAAEQIIAEFGVPLTTLRATQFHDLLFKTVQQMAKMSVIPVPAGARFQPVDAGEVGRRTCENFLRLQLNAQIGLANLAPAAGLAPYEEGVQAHA
jgi:uncharacterized protein YbjT (DUF2867 family)